MADDLRLETILDANTAAHDEKLEQAAKKAENVSRRIARQAREAAAAEKLYAQVGGDAVEEKTQRILAAQERLKDSALLYKTAQKTATAGNLSEEQSAKVLAVAYQRLAAAKLQLAEATEVENHTVSSRMAASAAVRGLESGNVGIRSVENFLTTIPGVGAALQTIFPVVGAVAFLGILVEMGSKLYEVGKKAKDAAKDITAAFAEQHEKAQVANDDLAIQNDKLGDEIAKLSGRPGNGLATALDESRKMADQLLVSLQGDRKELEALLKEHNVGALGTLFTGVAGTGSQGKELLEDQKGLSEAVRAANRAYESDVAADGSPKAVKAAGDKRNAAVRTAYQAQIATLQTESGRLKQQQEDSAREAALIAKTTGESAMVTDNSAKMANIAGRIGQLQDMATRDQLIASIGKKEAVVNGLKQQKESTAEAKKAEEERFHGMEAQLAVLKIQGNVSKAYELGYWQERAKGFSTGSAEYRAIVTKEATLTEEIAKSAHEAIEKQKRRTQETADEAGKLPTDPMGRWRLDSRKATAEAIDASNQANAQAASNLAKQREVVIGEAAGRTLTHQAAAAEMAKTHTEAYGAELDRLIKRQAEMKAHPELFGSDKAQQQRAQDDVAREITQTRANRTVQVLQDQYAVTMPNSSAVVGAKDALGEFTRASLDAAGTMKSLVSGTLSDVNKTLVEELTSRSRTGPRNLWHSVGKDFATRGTSALLEKGEGSILSMFGLGGKKKPTGAPGDPLHVVMDSLMGGGGVSSAIKGLGKGNDDSDSGGSGGGFGSVMGALSGILPGFATGVNDFGGGPAIVGEKGPEILNLPSGSSITPNNKISEMGGAGGGSPTIHVDARGATDPAQVEASVHRAMGMYIHPIMSATASSIRDSHLRKPSNSKY